MIEQEPRYCERCWLPFETLEERAEVMDEHEEVIIIHKTCVRETDQET